MQPRQRAARILPDSPAFAYGVLASVAAIFLAACAISFQGQAAMAGDYMGLTGAFRYLVPIVIDTSLLVYAAAALVRRSRGESSRWVIAASAFWVGVSVSANVVHALQPSSIIVGAALAVLAPLAILMSSLTIESLLVAPPAVGEKLDREAALSGELDAQRSEHAATIAGHITEATRLQGLVDRLERENAKAAVVASPRSTTTKALAAVPSVPAADDRETLEATILALKATGATNVAIASETSKSISTIKRILAQANKNGALAA